MSQRVMMIIAIVVIVVGGGIFALKELIPDDSAQANGTTYATKEVIKGDISVGVNTTGRLEATHGGGIRVGGSRSYYDGTNVSFIVEKILKEEGDDVKEGEVIMKLSSPDLDVKLDEAKDKLKTVKEELSDITGVPVSEVEELNPSKGIVLKSPIGGRVTGLDIEEGDELKMGNTVAKIVDDSKFIVKGKFSTAEVGKVKVGDVVYLKSNLFDKFFPATVKDIATNPTPVKEGNEEFATGFVHYVKIVGDNPGLVQTDMEVSVGVGDPNTNVSFFGMKGTVESFIAEERIISKAESIVTEVFASDMDIVKKGDPIVSMAGDDVQYKIETKLSEIRELKADIKKLEAKYGQLEVKASMNGVISYIETTEGEEVRTGNWVGDIYNTNKMELFTQVDDIDIVNVKQDAPVQVTIDAVPGEVFEGKVTDISARGEGEGGIAKFAVYIQVKGGEKLKPGMQANGFIDGGEAKGVLLVPNEAVFEEDGKTVVEVLREDNTVELRAIKVGLMNDRYIEAKSGVKEGEKIVVGSSADVLPSEHIQTDSLVPSKDKNDDTDSDSSEDK